GHGRARVRLLREREPEGRPPALVAGEREDHRRLDLRPPAHAPLQRLRETGGGALRRARPPEELLIARLPPPEAFVLTLIVLPGLWPAWPILRHDPSVLADPLKYILHHLGFVACLLLAIVLTFTPLVVLFPKWEIARAVNLQRTVVGVSAFVY